MVSRQVLLLGAICTICGCRSTEVQEVRPAPRVCGMTYSHIWTGEERPDRFSPRSEASLEELKELGVRMLAFTPRGWMDSPSAVEIEERPARLKRAYLDQVRRDAAWARRHGIRILVKPHVVLKEGGWVARAKPDPKRGGWPAWFRSYERFILGYARFAEEIDASWLSIGVELNSAVSHNPLRWRALIRKVRKRFSGKLTYTSTFDTVERVTFWGLLDLIGVAFFGDLASRWSSSPATLEENARKWREELSRIAGYYKLPLMLTEVGFVNREGTAKDPWLWPQKLEDPRRTAEGDAQQAQAYRAIIEVFGHAPGVKGLFWWKWFDDPHYHETPQRVGYSPRNKPAAALLAAACAP